MLPGGYSALTSGRPAKWLASLERSPTVLPPLTWPMSSCCARTVATTGARLVLAMIDDGPGATMRWMLHTADAHDLYARYGFQPPDSTYLERPATFS